MIDGNILKAKFTENGLEDLYSSLKGEAISLVLLENEDFKKAMLSVTTDSFYPITAESKISRVAEIADNKYELSLMWAKYDKAINEMIMQRLNHLLK